MKLAGRGVEIRVRNETTFDLERVLARFPDTEEVDYGALPRGRSSDFHATTRAYPYAPIRAATADGDLVFQPMDYVGEEQLRPGRYTYVLGVDGGVLTVTLEPAQAEPTGG